MTNPVRKPLLIVWFAGGGGSSIGIAQATGDDPDYALNHNATALGMHAANHPATTHLCEDAYAPDPRELDLARPVDLFWASPDCRDFSRAKGGAPRSPRIRGLAWTIIPWAKLRRPRVIILENVPEFQDWGPVHRDGPRAGEAVAGRRGETFRRFVRRLRQCGYQVEWRELVAADYGAPTTRKRFFLVARCDGLPIVWPAASHAPASSASSVGLRPWRAAAEIIDWSIPCPSIFDRRRPLAEATMRRIAKGIERYVIGSSRPFIVPITHSGTDRVHDGGEPLRTITTAHRGELAAYAPYMVRTDMQSAANRNGVHEVGEPLRTVTSSGGFATVAPILTPRYSEREGQEPRARSVERPYATVVATGNGGQLVAPVIVGCANRDHVERPGARTWPVDGALRTVTGSNNHALVAAFMEQANTGVVGHDAATPLSTTVGRGTTQRLTVAALQHAYTSNTCGGEGDPSKPAKTITAGGNHHYTLQADLGAPGAEQRAELRAFLIKYYGSATGQDLADPLHSTTSRARFGLVMVEGVAWQIVDIGMRMLTPRELFSAQGFPADYRIDADARGRPITKTNQTLMAGNAVPPPWAEALTRANLPWRCEPEERAAA